MRIWLPAAICVGLMIPGALWAQALESAAPAPTTHPSRPLIDRREAARIRSGFGNFAPDNPANNAPLTDKDRLAAEQFMETYSPKRWEKLQNLRPERKDRILTLIRNQIHMLDRLKQEDPKVYELRMSRLTVEDEMFSLVWTLKHDKSNTVDREALRASLHDEVQKFVDNSLAEQKLRIERMQAKVARQQQELDYAQAWFKKLTDSKDNLVEKGTADMEDEKGGVLKDLAGPVLAPRKGHDAATTPSAATQPSADDGDAALP